MILAEAIGSNEGRGLQRVALRFEREVSVATLSCLFGVGMIEILRVAVSDLRYWILVTSIVCHLHVEPNRR